MTKQAPVHVEGCPWCAYYIEVHARGQHGADQGAGVEAAGLMKRHIRVDHPQRTWQEFLAIPVLKKA